MEKFKKIHSNNATKIKSIQGEMRLLAETSGQKQKVEIWLLNDIVNQNNWLYKNLEEHRHLFAETPILVAYVGKQIGDGHNFTTLTNDDGENYASFMSATAERIVGYFKSESDIRIEERNGQKWIVGVGWIWSWYAHELVNKLQEQGLEGMSVSIETLIDEMHYEGTTEVYTKYQILGTTILGDDVSPAVIGANIRALSVLGVDNVRTLTRTVASQNNSRPNKNPQKQNHKENKEMTIKDLKGKFADFKIIAVENGKVALLSAKGEAFLSSAKTNAAGEIETGDTIAVNASVAFGNGEDKINVSLDSVLEAQLATIEDLTAKLEKRNSEFETVNNALKTMQQQENARREEAVKNAISVRLKEIKTSGFDVQDNICDALLTDEKVAEYALMVDKDGKFIGDEKARCDVDALCMTKILSDNQVKANAAKNKYSWQYVDNTLADEDKSKESIDQSITNILK